MKLIQSRDNPFFKSLKRLAESGRERRKTGQTLLDGVHLVEAYEAVFGPVETLIVAESALASGEISVFVEGRDTVVLADSLLRDLGLVDTPSGLLAVARMPTMSAPCCVRLRRPVSARPCYRRDVLRPGHPKFCVPGRVLTLRWRSMKT